MCSDAANGEYDGFKVKNEAGCSWEGEATTSESRLHLNDILEMLIRFDQQGIFMNPVDDSIAPDYSKVIKNPMCFLKMREKIHGEQYTSWDSFVDDFECICHNAMKYNQKRSKIWNSANVLLRQGKRCLEQQSARCSKILGISEVYNGTTLQGEVAAKVRLDQSCQGTQLNALSRSLDKLYCRTSTENLRSNFCEQQGPITTERNSTDTEMVEKEKSAFCSTSEPLMKSSGEDVNVEILTPESEVDARLNLESQATECSSSFSSTQSELEGESCEEESELRNGNGADTPAGNSSGTSRRKKRAFDSDWKTYRQGIEWQCHWLELRIEGLQVVANKYRRILESARTRKEQHHLDDSVARTSSMDHDFRRRVLKRRQRRRVEETADLMAKHPLFSRYGEKKYRNQELSSTEEGARDDKQHVMEFDDFNLDFEDEYEDNIVVEKDSVEYYLWQIEALQMRIFELKNQLIRGPTVQENTTKVQFRNHAPPQISVLGSPRNFSGLPTQVHSPNGLGTRSMARESKGHGGTPSRRRNSDFDINNVIMPDTEMANYVEPARHAFITTPHWRQHEDMSAQYEEDSSEEDTDDEIYQVRHAQMQMKERQQQYTPLPLNKSRNISVAKERPKIDVTGRGSAVDAKKAEDADNDEPTFPTSFGYIPRRKRRKRESREAAAAAIDSPTSLNISQKEKNKVCTRSNSIKNSNSQNNVYRL